MNNAVRASLYFVATVLMATAAVLIGRQFQAGEPPELLAPCVLALLGAGVFGFGLFAPVPAPDDCRVQGEAESSGQDAGDGGPD
jgi:hypothetical protein